MKRYKCINIWSELWPSITGKVIACKRDLLKKPLLIRAIPVTMLDLREDGILIPKGAQINLIYSPKSMFDLLIWEKYDIQIVTYKHKLWNIINIVYLPSNTSKKYKIKHNFK